jgi:hypothetical protein
MALCLRMLRQRSGEFHSRTVMTTFLAHLAQIRPILSIGLPRHQALKARDYCEWWSIRELATRTILGPTTATREILRS